MTKKEKLELLKNQLTKDQLERLNNVIWPTHDECGIWIKRPKKDLDSIIDLCERTIKQNIKLNRI